MGAASRARAPAAAAGVVVLGLLALTTLVTVGTILGVTDQAAEISASVDAAIDVAVTEVGADQASVETARTSIEAAAPVVGAGFLTELAAGIDTVVGLASGLVLGVLIMYYLLKDGSAIRASVVARSAPTAQAEIEAYIGDSCRVLRDYGRGRTVMSVTVAVFIGIVALLLGLPLVLTIMLVNFVGGYIPYIGAFLANALLDAHRDEPAVVDRYH